MITTNIYIIYLWRKVVCLFCLYLWDPPNWDASNHVLHIFWKLSTRRVARTWFHDVWTCNAKVLEYWMISSLKIKLNRSWKFRRNWNVPLLFLERSWSAGFSGIYWVGFGFRMWEQLIFKWFLRLKIQINSKKPGFGSWGRVNTWANGTGCPSYVWRDEQSSNGNWKVRKVNIYKIDGYVSIRTIGLRTYQKFENFPNGIFYYWNNDRYNIHVHI